MVCRVFFFKQKTACEVRISGRSSDVCSSDLSASWLIQAIDPLTGEVLQDATRGLLAPNNASGAGAGFVSYSVRPSDDVATGAGISPSARVLMTSDQRRVGKEGVSPVSSPWSPYQSKRTKARTQGPPAE